MHKHGERPQPASAVTLRVICCEQINHHHLHAIAVARYVSAIASPLYVRARSSGGADNPAGGCRLKAGMFDEFPISKDKRLPPELKPELKLQQREKPKEKNTDKYFAS
ncbi:hypothetical protein EVAR_38184_1 [Eumeta japonica]|uniref:Uncharacterized protein n=1 Tax=Eumeta variegata TaxID=151549 RepID=A0A4C1WDE0_EUMVA|nr:hypothetical protein EVAR_38184_1 [Eumeta japonica]